MSSEARGEEILEVTVSETASIDVEYRPWDKVCGISHVLKPGQEGDAAKSLTISGLAEAPRVTLNGRPADVRVAGQAFQISLA